MRWLALFVASASTLPAAATDSQWQSDPKHYLGDDNPSIYVTYVHYGPFERGFETGFAVGKTCPKDEACTGTLKDIVIRVVRRLPSTGKHQSTEYSWLETSLDACPAAYGRLKRLPEARWAPHMRMNYQPEQPMPEEFTVTSFEGQVSIVTASAGERAEDGTLRLLSGEYQFHGNADGSGNPADWAEALLRDIEPCLHPATAPPPWIR